jgi:hypothetical protein
MLLPLIQVHSLLPEELLVTTKYAGLDAPPPGAGLVTTTGKLPTVARSAVVNEIVI